MTGCPRCRHATADALDTLATMERVGRLVADGGRDPGTAAAWRDAAGYVRLTAGDDLETLRQRSIREEASLFGTHPPTGLRARMVRSRPPRDARVVLTDEQSRRIDAELAPWYDRLSRIIRAG